MAGRIAAAALVATSLIAVTAARPVPAREAARSASADAARSRAAAIVAKMTLDEKIALLHGLFPPRAAGKTTSELIQAAGHIDGIPRLGVPLVRESDASLGVANQVEQRKGDTATALPSSLATAASFDPAIAHAGGAMIGAEARAKRFDVLLAGGIGLTRDPWNGRNFEYLGEDPLLAGEMGGAHIAGVQSNRIVSTIKHFVLNAQETGRMVLDARIDEASLRMSDLLAFEIAIEKGRPGSVMCAYNKVNGDWACENRFLLTDVLKRDWGYTGWVMSDWGAVHSSAKAANAGLDQQSGQELDSAIFFGDALKADVQSGKVPMARIDDMVTRYLTGLIETGLFDAPADKSLAIPYAAHADVAQRAAEAGIVLLRNEGNMLPLAAGARKIVVIGGHADVGVLSGGGSSQVRSTGGAPVEIPLTRGEAASFARVTWHASSPLKAIRALAPNAEVTYVDGKDPAAAAAAARGADLAIVFAWQWRTEAQDAETLALPDNQDALIEAVATANQRSLVVLETGGPVLMPWLARVPAVLEAWYPGQRGGEAIANILFGDVNPSGRLPITFPLAAEQAPRPAPVGLANLHAMQAARDAGDKDARIAPFAVDYPEGANVGYRWYEKTGQTPLYPFGHGLSYTRFTYANAAATGGEAPSVSFDVTNAGDRPGADVPQVYVQSADAAGVVTWRLAGFARLTLAPGETRRVTVPLERRTFARFDPATRAWVVAGGPRPVAVAHSATDRALVTTLDPAPARLAR